MSENSYRFYINNNIDGNNDGKGNEVDYDDEDGEFDGKLLHQACLWDNSDLLSDLVFGEEVGFLVFTLFCINK